MSINEIFYSLQGEGARAGEPSIFVRLSNCDLTCGFCDTEFLSGEEMTCEQLLAEIKRFPGKWIVWTGGEPTLQLNGDIVSFFKKAGYKQAIETNGNNKVPVGLDWVAVSPKVAEHVVKKNFPDGVDELRYVRHTGQRGIPSPLIVAKHYFISPMFNGNMIDIDNLKHCTKLVLENPEWKLSVQTHKMMKIL